MYLTKLKLTFDEKNDIYKIHQKIRQLFSSESSRNFLYAIDSLDSDFYIVHIRSLVMPKIVSEDIEIISINKENITITKNSVIYFKIKTIPLKTTLNAITNKKQRIFLNNTDEKINWIKNKFLDIAILKDIKINSFNFQDTKCKNINHKIPKSHVVFSGRAIVTNPEFFKDILKTGIGTYKAFGFGLLQISDIKFKRAETNYNSLKKIKIAKIKDINFSTVKNQLVGNDIKNAITYTVNMKNTIAILLENCKITQQAIDFAISNDVILIKTSNNFHNFIENYYKSHFYISNKLFTEDDTIAITKKIMILRYSASESEIKHLEYFTTIASMNEFKNTINIQSYDNFCNYNNITNNKKFDNTIKEVQKNILLFTKIAMVKLNIKSNDVFISEIIFYLLYQKVTLQIAFDFLNDTRKNNENIRNKINAIFNNSNIILDIIDIIKSFYKN